ncbi:MAG: efflux RND transporter permease subunit [Planctomycetota bacterium]|nr:efflux RND transporter permease subunit [Planctomycetota bacterium]
MLNKVIAFSLKNRLMIVALALITILYGGYLVTQMKVDVLPDLNRPTVTIMTEATGLAPEEVEVLVTFPIESMMNGATDVQRVRSASGIGLSIVWVEFDWGTNIFTDRQIVAERLLIARERLPEGTEPVMTPISSIMGEIILVGLTSEDGTTSPLDIRTHAEWAIRPQLLAISGISQVTVMGGGEKQYQVITNPRRLRQYDVTLGELTHAVEASNLNTGGGFILEDRKEYLIRILGRVGSLEEIENAVVKPADPSSVLVKHVAEVRFGKAVQRGDGSVNSEPAIIIAIQKQPGADTIALTEKVDAALERIKESLPPDVKIHNKIFRQEEFINAAMANVVEALRDGAILVVIVLFLFLWNFRTSLINLTAIPLSMITTVFVFDWFEMSINTMTLGGLAVAIGELVDDSIVDVENIFRRLRENRAKSNPAPYLAVVFQASSEIRNSIVYATLIVAVVVVPLLNLGGIEGRMFAPVAVSYIVALFASLLVSVTVTPVLASYLLPRAKITSHTKDSFLLAIMKRVDRRVVRWALRHPYKVMAGAATLVAVALAAYLNTGGEFLPPFNEGTFTVNVVAAPGTSLKESNRLGTIAENLIREVPEVESTARRTGRAELDEHAENVNYSEIDVRLEESDRSRDEIMKDIRDRLAYMSGVDLNVGQPISHRIDHLLSGIRAQIAVKIFGPDLLILRTKAQQMYDFMRKIDGVVDLLVEAQVDIPQVKIRLKHDEIQRYGLTKREVAETLETALQGRIVSEVLEGQRIFEMVVWFDEASRNDPTVIGRTLIETPSGAHLPLSTFAEVERTAGPNTINRENVMRRIVVQCNVQGRDLASVIEDIRALEPKLELTQGYFVQYGGQFEAQQAAMRRIYILSIFAMLVVFALLMKALGSWRPALQCMVNLPLAFVGGVAGVYLFGDRTLSVASLIGFLTLTGIVMRNGIMMLSHYIHLMKYEGEKFDEQMIVRGTLERLAPVMMTAVTTTLGLVPLALGAGDTGKEILHPLAIVVIGGLISSTLLDQLVTPALFLKFGRKVYEREVEEEQAIDAHEVPADLMAFARRVERTHRRKPEEFGG